MEPSTESEMRSAKGPRAGNPCTTSDGEPCILSAAGRRHVCKSKRVKTREKKDGGAKLEILGMPASYPKFLTLRVSLSGNSDAT
jgi:hypothetical protein